MSGDAQHLLWIALSAALFNNIVLVNMLGLCPVIGIRKISLALGIGMATILVLTTSSAISYMFEAYLLPDGWRFARPLILITVIAFLVQVTELACRILFPALHRSLGVYLPLIVTNCAVLGTALLATRTDGGLVESAVYGAAGGIGFLIATVLLGCISESTIAERVPQPFRGAPLTVITAGIMSMSMQGLAGIGT